MTRTRLTDQVAVVGWAATDYNRGRPGNDTATGMALRASAAAIRDAGLRAADIDGVSGTNVVLASAVQSGLGLPRVTWWTNGYPPFVLNLAAAIHAIHAGTCETALVYHSPFRMGKLSKQVASDPFRQRLAPTQSVTPPATYPVGMSGQMGYAAWAMRYMHEFGMTREDLGRIAINSRTNAMRNPHAVYRTPMTMDDYLSARMIRPPLGMLDMDVPIDGASAFVLTTAERARDLVETPVYVHSVAMGQTRHPEPDQMSGFHDSGKEICGEELWRKSELGIDDMDLLQLYDGFTIICLSWFEALGLCKPGEAPEFLRQHWSEEENRLLVHGRVPVNTHGGSLSEGGTQGAGHFREALEQLAGRAGERQVANARAAVVTTGGFEFNATGMVLRS